MTARRFFIHYVRGREPTKEWLRGTMDTAHTETPAVISPSVRQVDGTPSQAAASGGSDAVPDLRESAEETIDVSPNTAPVTSVQVQAILIKIAELQPLLLQEVRGLRRDFEVKLKYDQAKERIIDALHQEVQQHRQGLEFTLRQPLFVDLISMYDDLLEMAEVHAGSDDDRLAAVARNLKSYVTTIEEILARNGVETFVTEGDEFDGKRQRVARTVPTDLASQANRISYRLRKGFEHSGRVVRPELVVAYKLTTPSRLVAPTDVAAPHEIGTGEGV